jgi:putative ABC transport system substrate-binding protein
VKRREFIAGLGSAAAWRVAAQAQQPERVRRIGVLSGLAADSPGGLTGVTAFVQELQQSGWTVGRNIQIDYRWTAGEADRYRAYAGELVTLAPDAILVQGSPSVAALQQATRTIPIVFVSVFDPVAAGFVPSLARPGGNMTGFASEEYGISGKWLELLKEIAPRVKRVGVLRDPNSRAGIGQFAAVQAIAPSLRIEVNPINVMRDAGEIERAITALGRGENGGLIVTGSGFVQAHRDLIIMSAARYKLPAVYSLRSFPAAGGLMSYGPDEVDPFRKAAGYVDRILKGERPADLPVMFPTKFDLVINVKTVKALGLTIPETLLATADEVIQ